MIGQLALQDLSIFRLFLKRMPGERILLLGVFVGFVFTTTIAIVGPIYLDSLKQLAFRSSVGEFQGRFLDVNLFASNLVLSEDSMSRSEDEIEQAAVQYLDPAYRGHTTYIRSSPYLVGIPGRELPDKRSNEVMLRGYIQHLSGLSKEAYFLDGSMAEDIVAQWPRGPLIQAVISSETAERFNIQVADVLTLATVLEVDQRVSVIITGVIRADDPDDEYWEDVGIYLDPAPLIETPPLGVRVDPDDPPIGLFVGLDALLGAVDQTNRGTLVDPIWFLRLDKISVSNWSLDGALTRLDSFTEQVQTVVPDITVRAGAITTTIEKVKHRGFLASIPILLLLVVMAVTVLLYTSIVISYLTKSRERDIALARSRGVGTGILFRIALAEGLTITVGGVFVAATLAFATVALIGKLPYFDDIPGATILQVNTSLTPVLAGAIGVLACLSMLVAPAILSARTGLLFQKLSVSRPTGVSWFHRYYLDVAVLVIGSLIYWELHSRGQVVSGGLFGDVGVNEPLLLAPVLFLIGVGLIFARLFPLMLRFFSGESSGLAQLIAVVAIGSSTVGILHRGQGDLWDIDVILPIIILIGFVLAYFKTARLKKRIGIGGGLVAQVGLIVLFFRVEPLDSQGWQFIADVGLIAIIPLTGAFLFFKTGVRKAPVWISVTLWRMGRNPLQYTWLVLLLVLVTGLGILATTVGGTLQKSQAERIMYEVGTDIRMIGSPLFISGGMRRLADTFEREPSITLASVALRTSGSVGPNPIEVLAVDVGRFPDMAWYREDFSDQTLMEVMGDLQLSGSIGLTIPNLAVGIGVWVKSFVESDALSLWAVLVDGSGQIETLTLGPLGGSDWHVLRADLPPGMIDPVRLVSIQIFEPGYGSGQMGSGSSVSTSGTILMDRIHSVMDSKDSEEVLDDFEGSIDLTPIITSQIPTDKVQNFSSDTFDGKQAAYFSFGSYRNMSVRGLLHGAWDKGIPVAVSSSLASIYGLEAGDQFIAIVAGRFLLAEVKNTVNYFPTMGNKSKGYMIANSDILHEYLNLLSPIRKVDQNQVFVTVAPGYGKIASETILEMPESVYLKMENALDRIEVMLSDPFSRAGWQVIVFFSTVIVVVSAIFGYTTYLFLFAKESKSEMAFLQSIGLSRPQLLGMLVFEHLIIVLVGIGLGTWAGFQVSELMISPLAVTETGKSIIPPFVLRTDWWIMGPTYILLSTVFLGAVAVLGRNTLQLNIQTLARVEDS